MNFTDKAHPVFIRSRSCVVGVLVCLIFGFTVHGSVSAQEKEIIPPDVLADLDASDLNRREEATRRLAADDSISSGAIEEMLVEGGDRLTFEQIDRLVGVLERRALDRIAVLGIEMRRGRVPIEIERIFMGAPANRVLRIDDRLLAIDDQALTGDDAPVVLQNTVTEKGIGDRVTLEIERDGETMRVRVELADAYGFRGVFDRSTGTRPHQTLARPARQICTASDQS